MNYVFVFGTLKKGFPNFNQNKGTYFGEYETLDAYPLYLVGERHSAWMVADKGQGHPVKGQVFQIDDAGLALMDKLERTHEEDGYQRVALKVKPSKVVSSETDSAMSVYAYMKPKHLLNVQDIKLELSGVYELKHAQMYRSRTNAPSV